MKEISLHILDLAQNSIRAGAKNIVIRVLEDSAADTFMVSIADDGVRHGARDGKGGAEPVCDDAHHA